MDLKMNSEEEVVKAEKSVPQLSDVIKHKKSKKKKKKR